jgi:hypothetical protein
MMLRRIIRSLVILIVLGAALNVLAAWACALLIPPDANNNGGDPMTLAAVRREFFERAGPDPGGTDPGRLFVSVVHKRPGVEFLDVLVEDDDIPSDAFRGPLPYIGYTRAGWPTPALEGEWHHDASRSPTPQQPRSSWSVPFHRWYVRGNRLFIPRMLPLRPMWPGFVVNLACWMAVAAIPFLLLRFVRWLRGRCPGCGYPIGTSGVCTECGRKVRPLAKLNV